MQASLQDLSSRLSSAITELSALLTSQEPIPERFSKVRATIEEHVHPLLEAATSRVQGMLSILSRQNGTTEVRVQQSVTATDGTMYVPNGNGNGHAVAAA